MDARCRIELLGGVRVLQGERVITRFRTQKAGTLLAYLAYHLPRAHPREVLIELLWPDVEPTAGRHRLSMALSSLRHQLEPPGVPVGAVIVADRNSVRLNALSVTTDVAEFETALQRAAVAVSEAGRARYLTEAIALYRSELLSGYYDNWIQTEQQRLAESFFQATRQLVAHLVAADDLDSAFNYALRAVRADPLRQEIHFDLMRLYASDGRPADALRQYQELKRLLQQELGVEPSDAVCELARQLTSVALTCRPSLPEKRERGSQATRRVVSLSGEPVSGKGKGRVGASARRPNPSLPLQFTRFFGREEEMARLQNLLRSGNDRVTGPIPDAPESISLPLPLSPCHLVTLTGPGGTGKTRLVLEVAGKFLEAFEEAVWFVPLSDLLDARLIAGAIVDVLRIARSPIIAPLDQIVDFFNGRSTPTVARRGNPAPALLVLDNFEHLLADERRKSEDGAAVVRALLERVPTLTLLVTSRQLLNLEGEQEFAVSPLPTPMEGRGTGEPRPVGASLSLHPCSHTLTRLMQCASVQLFVDRAQAVKADFQVTQGNGAAVAQLCDRLEGIPLAIELAAARIQVVTPAQMLSQLAHRFDFLVSRRRDALDRHRTLRASIDWSYRLLSPLLRQFFARLSVFRGGWTEAAAKAVCEAGTPEGVETDSGLTLDSLAHLRECSLILAEDNGQEMRFRMLETLRQYAEEQLALEERVGVRKRHRDFYLALAKEAERQSGGPDQSAGFDRLEVEHDNLRAALTGCLEEPESVEAGLQLAVMMFDFWIVRGYNREGREWLEVMLSRAGDVASLMKRRALNCAGNMAYRQGDYERASALFTECLALCQHAGDQRGAAHALLHLGQLQYGGGDIARGEALLEECRGLYQAVGDRHGLTWVCWNLALFAKRQGAYDRAKRLCEEALQLHIELGDRCGSVWPLITLAEVAHYEGDNQRAETLLAESLGLSDAFKNRSARSSILRMMGNIALQQMDYRKAQECYHEALTLFRELGDKPCISGTLISLGWVMLRQGDVNRAQACFQESLQLLHPPEDVSQILECLDCFAKLSLARRQGERAVRLYGALGALRPESHAEYENSAATIREALDPQTFDTAWARGQGMTLEQASAYALQETEAP
jgi:predicted ATPase/DNA-binding SARP family transcriptional activator